MAAESLLGGAAGENLSEDSKAMLDAFLGDTVGGEVEKTDLGGDSTLIVGKGANGETQGVVVSGSVAVAAEVKDGVMTLGISLPAGVNIGFEGLDKLASVAEAQAYIGGLISSSIPDANDPVRVSLEKALANLMAALDNEGGTKSVVRVVNIVDNSSSTSGSLDATPSAAGKTIVFDASGSNASEVLAIMLDKLKVGNTLELKGVEKAMLVGAGTVIVTGSSAANLQGDTTTQNITGGSGNDTLVGGGGNDTLDGGAGSDIFGFNAKGNYTVNFATGDKLAFQVQDVNSLEQLYPLVSNGYEKDGNVTFEFVDQSSITLVGVSVSDLTADMIKFSL